MGTENGGSIQYGYNFEMLNTFKMGHLKKNMFTHPVLNGPESDPWASARGSGYFMIHVCDDHFQEVLTVYVPYYNISMLFNHCI